MPPRFITPITQIGTLLEMRRRALKLTLKQFAAKIAVERRLVTGTDKPKDDSVRREIRKWGRAGATPPAPEWHDPIARGIAIDRSLVEAACDRDIYRQQFAGGSAIDQDDNPQPYRTDTERLTSVYRAYGDYRTPIQLTPAYEHLPPVIPPEIAAQYDDLVRRIEERAQASESPIWDGPNVRLRHFTLNVRRLDTGEEDKSITLHLAPVSWYQHEALNGFLDEPILEQGHTVRQQFAPEYRVYQTPGDFRWCQLSNIFPVLMVPITADGFGVFQLRNPRRVTAKGNLLISGVSENIDPFWDESVSGNPDARANPLAGSRAEKETRSKDRNYVPAGPPSPILTARRGVFEELSVQLGADLPITSYIFLNIAWTHELFHPALIGIINTNLTKADIEQSVQRFPGTDEPERVRLQYIRLDENDTETKFFLSAREQWVQVGLASLMTAINYYQDRNRLTPDI